MWCGKNGMFLGACPNETCTSSVPSWVLHLSKWKVACIYALSFLHKLQRIDSRYALLALSLIFDVCSANVILFALVQQDEQGLWSFVLCLNSVVMTDYKWDCSSSMNSLVLTFVPTVLALERAPSQTWVKANTSGCGFEKDCYLPIDSSPPLQHRSSLQPSCCQGFWSLSTLQHVPMLQSKSEHLLICQIAQKQLDRSEESPSCCCTHGFSLCSGTWLSTPFSCWGTCPTYCSIETLWEWRRLQFNRP